jgi:hypothetical protein
MPGIFISYRREDSIAHAGRLYDRLSAHFGKERVFIDLDTIDFGVDFVAALQQSVASCDVLIAVIGKQWLDVKDEEGRRRLDNPEDFVRIEIRAALDRDIRVIPVLVGGSRIPRSIDLPDPIAKLARRNALDISDLHFDQSVGSLIASLQRALTEAEQSRLSREKARTEAEEHGRVQDAKGSSKTPELLAPEGNDARALSNEERWKSVVARMLLSYKIPGFYIAPDIPVDLARAVRESCAVPESESVMGVLDCSGSGAGKLAIVFGARGLYYETGLQRGSVAYLRVPDGNDVAIFDGALSFKVAGVDVKINLPDSSMSARTLRALLVQLKTELRYFALRTAAAARVGRNKPSYS